jgi:catechol 2,3-dioxygenase-like lactoylglutathione lyase family enzyme
MAKSSGASPRIFRILVSAKDLNESRRFYESLLGSRGRVVGGGRVYFDCGSVILGVLDRSTEGSRVRTRPAEAVYLATSDLEGLFRRAKRLRCLDRGLLHGDPNSPLGSISVRPWGERSFYAEDPAGNPLCFVDAKTLFTGTPSQVAALRAAMSGASTRGTPRPSRRRR